MAEEHAQDASWPGVLAVESLTGTVSHGTGPSTYILTTYPQAAAPAEFGDLSFSDGTRTVTLRDCKVTAMTGRAGGDGQTFVLTILDRRWKWQTGGISGRYNQLDARGKLVPWSIRSPTELALLCLRRMGERNFVINLPPGLPAAAGANLDNFLAVGENFPQTLANPPVVWDLTPPAAALSQLAAQFGCRVVFQPIANRVVVTPPGDGGPLPDGPCEVITPSLDAPETPVAVGVAGAPVRVQMRFHLEPVGEEWDGSYKPINELSYAPIGAGAVQISTVTFSGSDATASTKIYVTYNRAGVQEDITAAFEYSDAASPADKLTRTAVRIAANADLAALMTASAAGNVLTLTGKVVGVSFGVRSETSAAAPNRLTAACIQHPKGQVDWESCPIPSFITVQPTARLSFEEARGLARKTVWRCYRIVNADLTTGKPPIKVPHYTFQGGVVKRRQQFILQPTKVEQVEPAPRRAGGQVKGVAVNPAVVQQFGGIMPDFYNGYARDQKACVYGSVAKTIGNVMWDGSNADPNTPADEKVRVESSIDPVEQIVIFSEPVFKVGAAGSGFLLRKVPSLVLETAVLITDPDTGEIYRWTNLKQLGGRAPTEWMIKDDIQLGIIGEYDASNTLVRTVLPDLGDVTRRAEFYLDGMAAKYRLVGGETRQYVGIRQIDPNGFVQQVSWSLGGGGPTTTASGNSEHSDVIPDFPARQRNENLAPNQQAVAANMAERAAVNAVIPKAPGDPKP